jgi:hypothetical protein
MSKLNTFALLVILMPLSSGAQETGQTQGYIDFGSGPLSAIELVELNEEINEAPAGQIYSVDMVFDEPVRLDKIREVASHLQVLRLLAFVEYGPSHAGYERSKIFIGPGTLYEGDKAWRHEICRAKIFAADTPEDVLLQTSAERWMVNEIHVYGAAYAVRELRSGTSLPSATITDGGAEGARSPQAFISYTRNELAKKIQIPDGRAVPEECQQFAERIEAAILTGRPTIQSPVYGNTHNPDFRSLIHLLLAERIPETPVTMRIVLNSDVAVDYFAALVDQYEIDGLTADLELVDSDIRASYTAELSAHGGSIESQVGRARCVMKLGVGVQITGEWVGRSARVSIPVSKAWDIVSRQDLVDAKLLTDFEAGALTAVEAYHRRKATEVLRIPTTMAIPSGCEQYIQHEQ